MRFAICIVALATSALTAGQSPILRRVGADGPNVLNGYSFTPAVAPNGWSLQASYASNVESTPSYGLRPFLRSPDGTLFPIPLTGSVDESMNGAIRDDGEVVAIQMSEAIWIYRRSTGTLRQYPALVAGGPFRIIDETLIVGGGGRLDLITGAIFPYPQMDQGELRPRQARSLGSNGRWRVANADGGFIFSDLKSGWIREWKHYDPTEYYAGATDASGSVVWVYDSAKPSGQRAFLRHDFISGLTESFPAPDMELCFPTKAAGRRLFFVTNDSLVAEDDNETRDIYAFDRVDNGIELISKRSYDGKAVGEIQSTNYDDLGRRVFFTSYAAGVTDAAVGPGGNVYERVLPNGKVSPVFSAKAPGSIESTIGSALSPDGETVLLSNFYMEWTLKLDVGGVVTRLPGGYGDIPRDVADGGKVALWTGYDGRLRVWRPDAELRILDAASRASAWWDRTIRVVVFIHRSANGRETLSTYDPATGTTRSLLPAGTPLDDFHAADGHVAYRSRSNVGVLNLVTGNQVNIPLEPSLTHFGPRLTDGGAYVSVASAKSLQDLDGAYGRYFRTTDGQFRRTTAFGLATADPEWVTYGGSTRYARTGALLPTTLAENVKVEGPLVGPPKVEDGYLFRAKAWALPTITRLSVDPSPNGIVSVGALFAQAGLENVTTWSEYRIDGGPWKRRSRNSPAISVQLADGPHLIEAFAKDNLDRIGPMVSRWVTADSTPPTVETPTAVLGPAGLHLKMKTDASSGSVTITLNGNSQTYGSLTSIHKGFQYVFSPNPGKTYTFSFAVRDQIGNTAHSPTGTFTVPN